MTPKDLYERDFHEWTQSNAALLRTGRFGEADIEHIAEEIEDMGVSQRHELRNRMKLVLMHLLKWQAQPERRDRIRSWRNTILVQRAELHILLEQNPSLRGRLVEEMDPAYRLAVLRATAETHLPKSRFPEACPFTIDQILDEDFFPQELE